MTEPNLLYCGDNLEVLCRQVKERVRHSPHQSRPDYTRGNGRAAAWRQEGSLDRARALGRALQALGRTYLAITGLSVGVLAVWLAVRDTADEPTLYRVLLAVGVLVISAALLAQGFKRLPRVYLSLNASLHDRLGLSTLQHQVGELSGAYRRSTERLRVERGRRREVYTAGLDEGARRERAMHIAPPDDAWPASFLLESGGSELVVFGRAQDPSRIFVGARVTLVTTGRHQPVGVIEVAEVSPDGQVLFNCVDRVLPDYWADLASRSASAPVALGEGIAAARYNPSTDHSGTMYMGDFLVDDQDPEEDLPWR